jgi:hypothetical protein
LIHAKLNFKENGKKDETEYAKVRNDHDEDTNDTMNTSSNNSEPDSPGRDDKPKKLRKKKRKSRSDRLDNLVDSLSHIYCTDNTSRSHRLPSKLSDMIMSNRQRTVSSTASTTTQSAASAGKKRGRRASSTATMSTSNNDEDEDVDVDESASMSPKLASFGNKPAKNDLNADESKANCKKKSKKRIKLEESLPDMQSTNSVSKIEVPKIEM